MKVKRVWECECGTTKLYNPSQNSDQLIIKGDAWHTIDSVSSSSRIITRCCSDKYTVIQSISSINKLKKIWECDHTAVLRSSSGALMIQGTGFIYGSPPTHIYCGSCSEKLRIAPEVVFSAQLAAKADKRRKSKARRQEKKNRR